MNNYTYHDLQDTLDKVVGKIGLERTVMLLKNMVGENTSTSCEERISLLTSLIISRCKTVFAQDFLTGKERECREGRMACYHLLRKYTNASYERVAKLLSRKKRNVSYATCKCEDLLSIPQFHKTFMEKYKALENSILEYSARFP